MTMKTSQDIRKSYIEKKNKVLTVLEKTRGFYTQNGDKTKEEVFEKLKENLENGEFSIVVVGEFSAGKSTLLNALMGQRILPSFTNETTATVNFLRHKDRAINGEVGRVYYRDGEEEELRDLSLATINEYVSTNHFDYRILRYCVKQNKGKYQEIVAYFNPSYYDFEINDMDEYEVIYNDHESRTYLAPISMKIFGLKR